MSFFDGLWTSIAPAFMLGCESSACVPIGFRMLAKLKRDPDLPLYRLMRPLLAAQPL